MKELTSACLKNGKVIEEVFLSINGINLDKKGKCFLIIQSSTQEYIKLTIYPMNTENVTKLSIKANLSQREPLNNLVVLIKRYEIIHTTGLVITDDKVRYECYLDYEYDKSNSQDLKKTLNRFKDMIDEIEISEIKLTE